MIAEKAMHYEIFRTTNSVYFYIETFSITRTPDKTTVVVEGVNSTKVALFWKFSLNANESIGISPSTDKDLVRSTHA